MINPLFSDFRLDVDRHLFVSMSLTSLSCNLFGYCPCKCFSFQPFCNCSSSRSLFFLLIRLADSIAISFSMSTLFWLLKLFVNFFSFVVQ